MTDSESKLTVELKEANLTATVRIALQELRGSDYRTRRRGVMFVKRTLRRVYKYPLRIDDETSVMLPLGAKVLSVQEQNGEPYIWALIDPHQLTHKRHFRFAGTGHDIDWEPNMVHRGTFQMRGGALVFHLFEYDE